MGPCMKLYQMYAVGDGVERDHKKAIGYIVKGCQKIEYGTCIELADLYIRDEQYSDAFGALEHACSHFSTPACDRLYEMTRDDHISAEERAALNARMSAKCVGRLQPGYCEKLKGAE